MQKQTIKSKQEGFTIIEVLIVLAIAALILLVVFLAVPGLQRSQRNNGRTNEASSLAAQITDFIGNNQGNLPGYSAGTFSSAQAGLDGTSILSSWGVSKVKYFIGISTSAASPALVVGGATTTPITSGNLTVTNGAITTGTAVLASGNKDALLIDDQALCGSSSTAIKTTAGSASNVALIYTTEATGTNYNQVCIQVQ